MKVSRYTFFFKDNDECYIYNSLSNALIKIDEESYQSLEEADKGKAGIDNDAYDDELLKVLAERNFITDNDDDDYLKLKSIIMAQRGQHGSMHLTLAPTMDCCFRCHYCFEKYKTKTYMTTDVMDAIIAHVKCHQDLKSIKITWFGGEPLMALPQIEQFYDKFKPVWGDRPYDSNVITTGYHIDKEAVRVLDKVGVKSVQITLDGGRETHNRVKHFAGSGDTFGRVLDNVQLYNDLSPDVNIVFRVNLTMDNADEYEPLQEMILSRFSGRKMIAIAPAFVMDRSLNGCKSKAALFSRRQCSEYILKLARKGIDSTFIRYPSPFFYECAIRNNVAISFDPEGYAYKCWELIGNKEFAIGRLDADGHIADINTKMLNRQLYGADPFEDPACMECKYLPICNGGCPINRIENKFDGGHNNCCTLHKGYMAEFLREHLRRERAGVNNKMYNKPNAE